MAMVVLWNWPLMYCIPRPMYLFCDGERITGRFVIGVSVAPYEPLIQGEWYAFQLYGSNGIWQIECFDDDNCIYYRVGRDQIKYRICWFRGKSKLTLKEALKEAFKAGGKG
jgi:hypothetical protein